MNFHNSRQAFLILAHKNYKQLNKLIDLLDHPNVDIFLHIDSKSPKYILPECRYSNVVQIPSMSANWGGIFTS